MSQKRNSKPVAAVIIRVMQKLRTRTNNPHFSGRARMHTQTIIRPIAITLLVLLGTISAVEAAEWRFEPLFRMAADFNDNPFLSIRTDVEESASGYLAEAALKVSYRSETADFDITPRFRSSAYDSDAGLDSDDSFLRFRFNRNTEKTSIRFRGGYSRESTRTAELADTDLDIEDPDEIPDDDAFVVLGRRERLNLVPTFTYNFSNVNAVSLNLNYTDTRYEDVFAGLLQDYTDFRVNASFIRAISERSDIIGTATARNYQTDQGNNEVKGVGLSLGFSRALSETTRVRAMVGVEDTELDGGESDQNWVADLSFVRILKTIRILAQFRRSIAASGSGDLATRDSFNLNFTRDLNDRISAGIGARVYTTNELDVGPGSFNERNYVQLRSQITWHISQVFSMEANYRYTFLDRESLGESSNANQVTLWLSYHPTTVRQTR